MIGTKLIPTSECILALFITHFATSIISFRTIKIYLAAIRYIHVCKGLHNHFNHQITSWLQLILRGIKRGVKVVPHLLITIPILHSTKTALSNENSLIWQHYILGCMPPCFFGFLRVSEFTTPADSPCDPARHLSLSDITIDNRAKPCLLQLLIKQSKTDPFSSMSRCIWYGCHW